MLFDIIDSVLQVAISFGQINLQLVTQQILDIGAEVRWEADLKKKQDRKNQEGIRRTVAS